MRAVLGLVLALAALAASAKTVTLSVDLTKTQPWVALVLLCLSLRLRSCPRTRGAPPPSSLRLRCTARLASFSSLSLSLSRSLDVPWLVMVASPVAVVSQLRILSRDFFQLPPPARWPLRASFFSLLGETCRMSAPLLLQRPGSQLRLLLPLTPLHPFGCLVPKG